VEIEGDIIRIYDSTVPLLAWESIKCSIKERNDNSYRVL